ncbi:MAG: hypothetical protein IPG84_06750 [Betaproteobacteria bacterium]|nr:hypothetical protein [Betaproteobacteria bacterium]
MDQPSVERDEPRRPAAAGEVQRIGEIEPPFQREANALATAPASSSSTFGKSARRRASTRAIALSSRRSRVAEHHAVSSNTRLGDVNRPGAKDRGGARGLRRVVLGDQPDDDVSIDRDHAAP